MPRKAAVVPNRHLHTTLDPELMAKIDLLLWSEVEGKVPQGEYQKLVTKLFREFLEQKKLDLAPYIVGGVPGEHIVAASPRTIHHLQALLSGAC